MHTKTIVTNLRIPEADLRQAKAEAAELNMSFNEYVKYALRYCGHHLQLGVDEAWEKASIWNLPVLAEGLERGGMGASEDDEVIYG